jgi:hypothetical protein
LFFIKRLIDKHGEAIHYQEKQRGKKEGSTSSNREKKD